MSYWAAQASLIVVGRVTMARHHDLQCGHRRRRHRGWRGRGGRGDRGPTWPVAVAWWPEIAGRPGLNHRHSLRPEPPTPPSRSPAPAASAHPHCLDM